MKIKAIIAALVGAATIQGAAAGEWCPPMPEKCPIEDCPDLGLSMSVGYESDYIFYGARLAQDSVWADVSYTFDGLPLPVTIGVWYLSAFNPDVPAYGDEADFYVSVELPSVLGFEHSFGYTAYTFPTGGYSTHELAYEISREIWCGVYGYYRAAYDFNVPNPGNDAAQQGAWVHKIGLGKSWDISDCVAFDLSGGVLYTDNYYEGQTDWNSYYIQAALPIALSCRATLTPYVGYNGVGDGWVLDQPNNTGLGDHELVHWGISLGVDF